MSFFKKVIAFQFWVWQLTCSVPLHSLKKKTTKKPKRQKTTNQRNNTKRKKRVSQLPKSLIMPIKLKFPFLKSSCLQ